MKNKKSKPLTPSQHCLDNIMFNEAGSSNDCTGLIPSAVLNESEYKSYQEIYDFNLPKSVRDDIEY